MIDAKLVVVGGDAKSGEVKLRLPTVIGRGKEAGLTVPHALVSRRHTEIYEKDGRLCVRDLGSLNGTFVNNTRIEGEQILEPNQLLTLGNITFRAVYDIPQPQAKSDPGDPANQTGHSETIRFEEASTETDHDNHPEKKRSSVGLKAEKRPSQPIFDETIPVDSLSDISSISGLSDVVSDANSAQEKPSNPQKSSTPRADKPAKATGQSDVSVGNIDRDGPQIDIDLRSDIFTLEEDQEASSGSVSISAIDRLDLDQSKASFVESVDLGDHQPQSKSIDSSISINLGEETESSGEVDESRLGSFLKKLDQ